MKFTLKKSISRSGLTAALSVAVLCSIPSLARADAVAQAILVLSGFTLTTPTAVPTGGVSGIGSVNVGLNGVNVATGAVPGVNYGQSLSLGAGYVANSKILGSPTATFAGGRTEVTGNAFLPAGTFALSDSTVSLNPAGTGNSNTITGTDFEFTFALGTSSVVSVAFNADLFLRAFLAGSPILVTVPTAGATVNSNWSISIQGLNGLAFNWAPNGVLDQGSIFGGTETLDPFALSRGITASRLLPTPQVINSNGTFAAVSNTLAAGNYTMTINHKTDAAANVQVPEPGTLALVGLSLVGVAAVGRRRAMRQAA